MIAYVVVFSIKLNRVDLQQCFHYFFTAVLSLLLDFATFVLIKKTLKEAAKIIEVIIMLIYLEDLYHVFAVSTMQM